jgi:hypothetical protein
VLRPRQFFVVVLLTLAVAGSACVSRNAESIGSDEAAQMGPPPEPVASADQPASVVEVPGIDGNVRVSPDVSVVPSGALFVIVRVSGRETGPPLAVKQLGGEVPTSFRITEENAMIPGTPFVGDLDVIVRLDQDANAFSRQPGDLEGRGGPVQAGGEVDIVLEPASVDEGGAEPAQQ